LLLAPLLRATGFPVLILILALALYLRYRYFPDT
jgi:hypothetical protein